MRKKLGSSREIKFQGPEEAKKRIKKEFNKVDSNNKDCDSEGCQS